MQAEHKRPISVTIVGWIFIATGIIGVGVHAAELKRGFGWDVVAALAISVVAVLCGAYILRGSGWARWLAVAWLGFHVAISVHSPQQLAMHGALFVVFAYLLFRASATTYFCARGELAG
jgi:hypothetical protein